MGRSLLDDGRCVWTMRTQLRTDIYDRRGAGRRAMMGTWRTDPPDWPPASAELRLNAAQMPQAPRARARRDERSALHRGRSDSTGPCMRAVLGEDPRI